MKHLAQENNAALTTTYMYTVDVCISSVLINGYMYNLYSFRLQETNTASPVLMQEDTNRTLYKPQVYVYNISAFS